MLLATIAFLLAIAFAEIVLPYYNTLVGKNLEIDYGNPVLWLVALAIILVTGVMAGSYPAFYLSAFRPVAVLKGKVREGRKGSFPRKVMVTVQFFFSIVLIICTIVIYQQLQYLRNRAIGYDQNNLLMTYGELGKNYKAVKKELLDQRLASSITNAYSPITIIYSYQDDVIWPGKREDQRHFIADVSIGYDYSKTTGTKMLEGRDFSENFNDSASVILNRAAVNYMGLKNPIGTTLRKEDETFVVIGVVEDMVMTSPYQPAEPTTFFFNKDRGSNILIRLELSVKPQESLKRVEKIFEKYNPEFPFNYRFADDDYNRKFASIELIGKLSNLFAFLAIFISCLGLFGLAAFTAENRTKEIGIRKVLGASVSSLVSLLSKEFALLVLIAFLIAAPLTIWQANEILQQYAYRVTIPWWVPPLSGFSALTLAILTVSSQAIKAALGNPVNSLRNE